MDFFYAKILWKIQNQIGILKKYASHFFIRVLVLLTHIFSLIIRHKGDTSLKYVGLVCTIDSSKQMLALNNNSMCENDN